MRSFIVILFLILTATLAAQDVEFYGEAQQGGIIIGKGKNISAVQLNGTKLPVDKNGYFILGFDRNATGLHKLKIRYKNKKTETIEYNIEPKEYEEQSLTISKKYVSPPRRESRRIRRESGLMKSARAKVGKLKTALYSAGFSYPVDSISIGSVFGSQRILNGRKANIHNGLDFSADEGDSIRAISDGIVRLAGSNFYYNGNFILLDHGQGLTSIYLHLSKLIAGKGGKVKRGDVIGLAGSTGRSTGPHLHLGVQWYKKRIDPQNLLNLELPSKE